MPPKKPVSPLPPGTLGVAGKALWRTITADIEGDWSLDARELHALAEASRLADQLAEVDAAVAADGVTIRGSRNQTVIHPGVAEGRQLRLAQLRLLSVIELTDPEAALKAATPAQARGRRAAQARWSQRAARGGA